MQQFSSIITSRIQEWLVAIGISGSTVTGIANVAFVLCTIVVAILVYAIIRLVFNLFIKKIVARTVTKWDDYIFNHKLFSRLLYYIPVLLLYSMLIANYQDQQLSLIIRRLTYIVLILLTVRNVHLFLQLVHQIYQHQEFSQRRPIKGILQIIAIFIYIVGGLLCITTILDTSPLTLLGGVSAVSAVLLLVFKDPILGIISGIQLSANNMLQIGDWIEIPEYNADGEVIDINMQSVRVRNWNKTIVSLPIYSLVSQSFINWRGMSEAGGRRIKRSIAIDVNSVKFCDAAMLKHFVRFSIIKDYITSKEQEVATYNQMRKLDSQQDIVSSRALTNLGTFRAYVFAYLRNHPHINQSLTLMVRHLQPTPHGIPMQIYAFCSDIAWERYESVQADIFDHIIAAAQEFDLRIYQSPSGSEVAKLIAAHNTHTAT